LKRRRLGALLAVGVAGVWACRSTPPAPAPSPSLLIVTLDTVRADVVPGFGGSEAALPELARWIGQSTRFTRAYTTAPMTLPAHLSLFSGVSPARHGIRNHESRERRAPLALLDAARRAGLLTAAFVSFEPLEPELSRLTGFDHFDHSVPSGAHERDAADVAAAAVQWITGVGASPVLVWAHFFDAHYPYRPRVPRWRSCPAERRAEALALAGNERLQCLGASAATPEPWVPLCLRDLYEGEVERIDTALGGLRAVMSERGPFVWVIVADHGECLGEEGLVARHAGTLLECAVHIPLAIGSSAGGPTMPARDELASLVDIAPTVAGLLGWPLSEVEGRDLFTSLAPLPRVVRFEAAGLRLPGCTESHAGAWIDDEKVVLSQGTGRVRSWRKSPTGIVEVTPQGLSDNARQVLVQLRAVPPPPPLSPVTDQPGSLAEDALRALGYVQ
jgi:choline-sulfatase